jgi:hypothetical protein
VEHRGHTIGQSHLAVKLQVGCELGERLGGEYSRVSHQEINASEVLPCGYDELGSRCGNDVVARITSASTNAAPIPCDAPVTIAVLFDDIYAFS